MIVVIGHCFHSIVWFGYTPSGVESTSEETSVTPEDLCSAGGKKNNH